MDFQEAVEKLKSALNTKQGRIAVVLGTVLGASVFLSYLKSESEEPPISKRNDRREYKSLIDERTRRLYLQDLKAEQEQTKKQVGVLQEQILKLKEQIEKSLSAPQAQTQPETPSFPARQYIDNRLVSEIRALRKSLDAMNRRIDRIEQKVEEKTAPVSPEQVTRYKLPIAKPPTVRTVKPGQSPQGAESPLLEGFYPAEEDKEIEELFKKTSRSEGICLPQGSFGKVIALSGLSAPTGPRASQDPVPVLFVIPGEFIKPNIRRNYKLRNCFALGWGAGDLSSERIKIKVRNISCELKEGKPLKLKVAGYIVGPDGKEGIRGVLVEKRGQYLAKALMASFVEGLSAVARYSTAVVSVSPLGATQTVPPEKAFKYGFGLGVERSLRKLSDYYLQLADEVLPVIEIGSGVSGTLIMLQEACEDRKEQKPWSVAVEETKKKLAKNPIKQPSANRLQEQLEEAIKPFYGGMME